MDSNVLSVLGLQDMTTSVPVPVINDHVTIWPDPAHCEFWIGSQDRIERVRLIDMTGREVRSWVEVGGETPLGLEGVSTGNYLVEVTTPLGMEVKKLTVN